MAKAKSMEKQTDVIVNNNDYEKLEELKKENKELNDKLNRLEERIKDE